MLSGDLICLKPFSLYHKKITRIWSNDPAIMRFLGRARPVGAIEHEEWFNSLHKRQDAVYFAIETKSEEIHIGNVWLTNIDQRHRKAEIQIMIGASEDQSRGAGSEAIRLITEYAFSYLNLHKVYAYVLSLNPRAKKAFEKCGFSLEGTLRKDRWSDNQYIDVYFFGKINE